MEELTAWMKEADDFTGFVKNTFPKIEWGWFYDDLCLRLQRFMRAVQQKKSPRLIVNVPPRHGKSEICTVRFPLWAMLNNDSMEVISCSYGQNLAINFSRKARELIKHEYVEKIWGKQKSDGQFAAENWSIDNKSTYLATSIDGTMTGKGGHDLIIDDPYKNLVEADSAHYRKLIYEWYASTVLSRLAPGGGIIIVMQRWNELDLTGQLLRKEKLDGGDKWDHINYQAIADKDEKYRKKGEPLLASRFGIDALKNLEANMVIRVWLANYQQSPTAKDGNCFKTFWFNRYTELPATEEGAEWITSWDLRFGASQAKSSSFVCGQVWLRIGAKKYLVDQVRGRWDFSESLEAFEEVLRRYPQCHTHLVENKANGPAMESVLSNRISGIMLVPPRGDKVQRAEAVQPTTRAGNVYIPNEEYNVWVVGWLDEVTRFPGSDDDDQVDCFSQAVNYMLGNETSLDEVLCHDVYSSFDNDDF